MELTLDQALQKGIEAHQEELSFKLLSSSLSFFA